MGRMSPPIDPIRRSLIAAFVVATASASRVGAATTKPPVVTILGDSITAGYGLPAADALPAQLQAALARLGVMATVRGAGVSGDTTAGALARVEFSVQSDTAVCVVELGGNDFLQSISAAETERNLNEIVLKLKRRHVRVVLASGKVPLSIAGAYGRDLAAVFPRVAKKTGAILSTDLLEGVFDGQRLKQGDGLHPNAAGARLVAERLAPTVAKALR